MSEYDHIPFQPPEDDFNSPEARWSRLCAYRVALLLASLRPLDAHRELFCFADIRQWKFNRNHKNS